jgi:dipeptidyl aminopeptidase/acylaminoacyl peptidase
MSRGVRAALFALAAPIFLASLAATPAAAQGNRGNYELAEKFSREYLNQFSYGTTVNPGWIGRTDFFWYSFNDSSGTHYYLVNPEERVKIPLFDRVKMAAEISKAVKRPVDTTDLDISNLTFTDDGKSIRFQSNGYRLEYELSSETMTNLGRVEAGQRGARGGRGGRGQRRGGGGGQRGGGGEGEGGANAHRNYAPDRTAFVFAMNHNLYYVEGGESASDDGAIQLSTDGEQFYSFGGLNPNTRVSDREYNDDPARKYRPGVNWAEDSKAFYVTRTDSRKVKDLYLVNSLAEPRPTMTAYKYAMPGEPDVNQTELFIFRRADKELVRVAEADKWKDQRLMNLSWHGDGSAKVRFVRRNRLQRNLEFCELDVATASVRALFGETTEFGFLETQGVRDLPERDEMIWFSERDGWGHYYLYSREGELKNQITRGAWRAASIVTSDSLRGILYVNGQGREPGENPYHQHLYRVNVDGTGLTLLDPGNATHNSRLSPSRRFVVDTYQAVDIAPKTVVRDAADGSVIMELEEADLSRLYEAGWKMPETFTVKAADGVTDITGNMWKPFDFDPNEKYPIVAHVYPGPQTESVSNGFSVLAGDQQLANLGFIVIQIGNRGGNPARSNAYHSYGYFNLRDYGLADKKAGIEQLANRHPWIDIKNVGMYGQSGGGFMTAAALLLPPYNEFFTVGVSSAGNHDNNIYNQNWSEQHHGLREVRVEDEQTTGGQRGGRAGRGGRGGQGGRGGRGGGQQQERQQEEEEGETRFDIHVPANHELAENLKGRLLLVHGDMDNNVHPGGTIRLVNALILAGKRFDFMIMPGKAHGFGDMQPYFTRMMWDYFTEHLLGDYHDDVEIDNPGRRDR